jgi:hypothetical protein
MLVTILLRNGLTDFYEILYAYSVGLRIGYYLFFIPLSDKGCSLMTVASEISKYKFDLVGVQAVRWEGGGTEPAGEYTIYSGKGNENHELGTGFFVHRRIVSAVKRVEFISDRMSY